MVVSPGCHTRIVHFRPVALVLNRKYPLCAVLIAVLEQSMLTIASRTGVPCSSVTTPVTVLQAVKAKTKISSAAFILQDIEYALQGQSGHKPD
jgi:hypothetical protein